MKVNKKKRGKSKSKFLNVEKYSGGFLLFVTDKRQLDEIMRKIILIRNNIWV